MDRELLGNYQIWAEKQVQDKIAELSDSEFTSKHDGIGRSIRELVEHLWVTWESYFHPPTMETWKDLSEQAKNMDRSELINTWEEASEKFAKKMNGYEKEEVEFPVSKEKILTLKSDDFFLLYTDHQTYHRGQLMTIIKYLGKEGVNTDYFTFVMVNPQ
ncbi:MAG: DinB family protein [Candidatus Kariarchaeaceae archaeon]|jgi:uncharacterized damage-inducible protein DinB